MEFDDSRINNSEENEYTYIIQYNFLCLIAHVENIVPPVIFIYKFSVVLSFQNLKNNDINILKYEIYLTFIHFSTPDNLQSYICGYK